MKYRNDPYFNHFIEKMKLKIYEDAIPEEQKVLMKDIFKQYTSFFSSNLPLTKLLEAILKPMNRGIKKSSAVSLVKKFTEYFEKNCQKYYMSYITSGYECSMLVQDLFTDIGEVIQDMSSDKTLINSLREFIEIMREQYPGVKEKIDPVYNSIKSIIEQIEKEELIEQFRSADLINKEEKKD
jgi:hypothetical protein